MNYDSLLDSEAVPVSEVNQHGVVISVPTLYVNADEMESIDRVVPNLRVIQYEKLVELMHLAIDINSVSKSQITEKCNYLITYLTDRLEKDESATFMEFIKFSSRISKDLDLDDEYYDVTTSGISFDAIRAYTNDPHTGVLQGVEAVTFENYQFYSEIPDDEYRQERILAIRKATNDTDFNRIQLHLAHFERTLTFTPNYVYSTTLKLKCLALFYVALYVDSRPIQDYCNNDLKGNLLGYILDCVVRSRVIQAWQRDEVSRKLNSDIVNNFDTRIPIIRLCQLKSARERAQHFIERMRSDKQLRNISSHFNFDAYMKCLAATTLNIEGKNYYLLGSDFISSIAVNLPDLKAVQDIYEQTQASEE